MALGGFFCYFYIKYDRIIAQRFRSPVFSNSAKIYALPRTVHDGDKIDAKQIAALLLRAGYSDKDGQSPLGSFHLVSDGIEITPGPESYHSPEAAHIAIEDGQVDKIVSRGNELSAYELEPQLVTALFDSEQRSKRQVVKYADIPKVMIDAVLAIEDRRFFEHSGVNFIRMFEAGWIDLTAAAPRAGRFDHHHAALARLLLDAGKNRAPQADRDADCRGNGAEVQQAADF